VLAPEVKATRIAVPIALLWLTNAPAAVIGCYATLLLVIFRVATARMERVPGGSSQIRGIAVPAAIGIALGIGLAGFYLIPAAWERRFVQVSMATIVNMRIDHNFLFEHTGSSLDAITHDQVLRTASWVAVLLLTAACVALLVCWRQGQTRRSPSGRTPLPVVPLLLFVVGVAFLLTGWSNPVWQHTPELLFLQFPWRLLIIVAPVFAIGVAVAVSEVRVSHAVTAVAALACAAMLTFSAYKPFHQVPEAGQTVADRLHAFIRGEGAEPTDEYTPQTADNDALTPGKPPYWLASGATAPAPALSVPGPAPSHLSVEAPRPEFLILNLRDYPSWRILVNSRVDAEREQRDDGLIAFAVPAGTSRIDIRYARGFDALAGDGVSLISAVALSAAWLRKPRPSALA
jgi:cytochrome bd-type quinol oxidase subunit 2